ncbi:putative DNA-directed RNA polymerase III subunit RPC6 [Paratrimastix pyriformis]|uniref:DNA-directed RNA polymerase III subunit RPC6 n=1 Tax=Paratrimastix pyriformis TaxID=342808 RepID=A0ABQ8UQY9_9EUKA|nr:putative DNA-directed RNA polymerase III subunit RPC6 [Paratrimastix pyriformis]
MESVSAQIQERILALLQEIPSISQKDLLEQIKEHPPDVVAVTLNDLLTAGKVAAQQQGGALVFTLVGEAERSKTQGLSPQDGVILEIIKQAGNKGIWTRELRFKSNMQPNQIQKALKTLQARKLIKQIKSPSQRGKRLYMLFELEPVREVWFTDSQDFDVQFINVLRDQCLNMIIKKGFANVGEITTFVRSSGISKVELRPENVQSILDTLVYDGEIEGVPDPRNITQIYYRAAHRVGWNNFYGEVPCATCPIFDECSNAEQADICPQRCPYFTHWLTLEPEQPAEGAPMGGGPQ